MVNLDKQLINLLENFYNLNEQDKEAIQHKIQTLSAEQKKLLTCKIIIFYEKLNENLSKLNMNLKLILNDTVELIEKKNVDDILLNL